MGNLGRLEKVELRDIWKTEDRDFTPWLAGEDNMSVLSDALGMDLEVEAQEQNVGPFRADIMTTQMTKFAFLALKWSYGELVPVWPLQSLI